MPSLMSIASFLAKYSTVLKDMLSAPQGSNITESSEEAPVMFPGDCAAGWELLLSDIYGRHPIEDTSNNSYTGDQLLLLLEIAHKYCMETVENRLLKILLKDSTSAGLVNRIVASRIVGSTKIYHDALKRMIYSRTEPTEIQVQQIGLEALYSMFMAVLRQLEATEAAQKGAIAAQKEAEDKFKSFSNLKCKFCSTFTNWECDQCNMVQTPNIVRKRKAGPG